MTTLVLLCRYNIIFSCNLGRGHRTQMKNICLQQLVLVTTRGVGDGGPAIVIYWDYMLHMVSVSNDTTMWPLSFAPALYLYLFP